MDLGSSIAADVARIRSLVGGTYASDTNSQSAMPSINGAWRELCIAAGVNAAQKQSWFGITFVITLLLLVLPVFVGVPMLSIFSALPVLLLRFKIESLAQQRAHEFERDYAAFLLALASSVRTGLDPLQAMSQSVELFDLKSEMGKALQYFRYSVEQGYPEEQAIREFAGDVRHPDISMFRTGFMLSRREGSSLAECLQRLARVTRQRQSFRRKMKSAVAMQRLSGFGIAGCAILICTIQALSNPKAFGEALAHPVGIKLIGIGAFFLLAGTFWMLRMTRTKL